MPNLTELGLVARSSDPADPPDGKAVVWLSDGTGSGSAGDILMKISVAGTTKIIPVSRYGDGVLAAARLKNPKKTELAAADWSIGTAITPTNPGPNYVMVKIDVDHAWSGASSDDFEYNLDTQESDATDQDDIDQVQRSSSTGLTGTITDDWRPVLAGWVGVGRDYIVREISAADAVSTGLIFEFAYG